MGLMKNIITGLLQLAFFNQEKNNGAKCKYKITYLHLAT